MAGLADDWEENRQTCSWLCAYLRLPYEIDPGDDAPAGERIAFQSNREIRHVVRVITTHLREDAVVSWQHLDYDFRGAVFDGGDFFWCGLLRWTFSDARFIGPAWFLSAQFRGSRVFFREIRILRKCSIP